MRAATVPAMESLILVRHGHAVSNVRDVVSCRPPGEGLSETGVREALLLRRTIADEAVGLGVSSRLARAQETLEVALGQRDVERLVVPELDDIHFGAFEGGPLTDYRAWAWAQPADAGCPGGGESRLDAALRVASALELLLQRDERLILAVSHALPVRYVVGAADGVFPPRRIGTIPHAHPYRLSREQLTHAIATLRRWATDPRFSDEE